MKIRKIVRKTLDEHRDGVDVVGGVHAAISANVNEKRGSSSRVSSRQRLRVVQRGGRTEVLHEEETSDGGEDG
jgi:hypothetical protein